MCKQHVYILPMNTSESSSCAIAPQYYSDEIEYIQTKRAVRTLENHNETDIYSLHSSLEGQIQDERSGSRCPR